jgi:hypothetical protein
LISETIRLPDTLCISITQVIELEINNRANSMLTPEPTRMASILGRASLIEFAWRVNPDPLCPVFIA